MSIDEKRNILKQTGVRQKRAAQIIGISPQYLSEYLNNKRLLSTQEMIRLDNYFDKLRAIL